MKLDTTAIAIPATDDEAPSDPMKRSDFNCFELYQTGITLQTPQCTVGDLSQEVRHRACAEK